MMWDLRTIGFEQKGQWDEKEQAIVLGPTVRHAKLSYPFTGCPWCGVWWCTGPLDAGAYPKVDQSELFPAFMRALNGRVMIAEDEVKELSALHSRKL